MVKTWPSPAIRWMGVHLLTRRIHPGPGGFHMPQSNYAHVPQLLGPRATTIEACAPGACALPEKPGQRDAPCTATREQPPLAATREGPRAATKTPSSQKSNK